MDCNQRGRGFGKIWLGLQDPARLAVSCKMVLGFVGVAWVRWDRLWPRLLGYIRGMLCSGCQINPRCVNWGPRSLIDDMVHHQLERVCCVKETGDHSAEVKSAYKVQQDSFWCHGSSFSAPVSILLPWSLQGQCVPESRVCCPVWPPGIWPFAAARWCVRR